MPIWSLILLVNSARVMGSRTLPLGQPTGYPPRIDPDPRGMPYPQAHARPLGPRADRLRRQGGLPRRQPRHRAGRELGAAAGDPELPLLYLGPQHGERGGQLIPAEVVRPLPRVARS